MTTALDLAPAPAPQPPCRAAAWCIGHITPGDTVHLSPATTIHGLPLWLKRVGDGPTVVARGRAGRTLELSVEQAREACAEMLRMHDTAYADNLLRSIAADTGSEA